MRTFEDAGRPDDDKRVDARKWIIDLPFGAVMRVKATSDGRFNLLDHELAPKLWEDLGELFELLWFLLEQQADKAGISAEEFGLRMAADAIFHARDALWREWSDFFRGLQQEERALVLEKMLAYHEQAHAELKQRLSNGCVKDMDLKAGKIISQRLSKAFGVAQERLDTMLDSSPGGKSTKPRKAAARSR